MCFKRLFAGPTPTARWGRFSFFMSLALFFWALAPSFYAMYISWEGGEVMPPFGWEWLGNVALICCFVCFGMGMVFAVIFLVLGIKWIFEKPLADPLLIDLREMKKSLGQMEVDVARMGKAMELQDNTKTTGEIGASSQGNVDQPTQIGETRQTDKGEEKFPGYRIGDS